jgi:hypothetical protein
VPNPVCECGVFLRQHFLESGSRLFRVVVIEQERINGRRSDDSRRVLSDHSKGKFVGFLRGQVRYPFHRLGLEHLEKVATAECTVPHFIGLRQLLPDQMLETAEGIRAPQFTDHRQRNEGCTEIRLAIAVKAFEEAVNDSAILSRHRNQLAKPFPVLTANPARKGQEFVYALG